MAMARVFFDMLRFPEVNLIDPNVLFWRPAEEILPAIVGVTLRNPDGFNVLDE